MNPSPRISVIIPIKNGQGFISKCLSSLENQLIIPYEVIIIDDHSDEEIKSDLASEFQKLDIKIYLNDGKGVSAARNKGIKLAKGEWIAFLDCDDYWGPKKLINQIHLMEELHLNSACSSFDTVDENDEVLGEVRSTSKVITLEEVINEKYMVYGSASSVIFKSTLRDKVGFFDENLSFSEDLDYWLRLLEFGNMAVDCEVSVHIKRHNKSTQFKFSPSIRFEKQFKSKVLVYSKSSMYKKQKINSCGLNIFQAWFRKDIDSKQAYQCIQYLKSNFGLSNFETIVDTLKILYSTKHYIKKAIIYKTCKLKKAKTRVNNEFK
jgi:glycosyltransferase involved in cell wall biosynthesis